MEDKQTFSSFYPGPSLSCQLFLLLAMQSTSFKTVVGANTDRLSIFEEMFIGAEATGKCSLCLLKKTLNKIIDTGTNLYLEI